MFETAEELLGGSGRVVSLLEFVSVDEAEAAGMGQVGAAAAGRAGDLRVMMEAARAEAAAEVRQELQAEMEARLEVERGRVDQMRAQFAKDRERYFGAAEGQVVRLALAVARRVLSREVAGDPMHLAETVRAALERVREGTATVLRVPNGEAGDWSALFSGGVEVVADEALAAGECVLETSVGRVEMGVEVQMGEIERGFGELLRRQGE